MAHARIKLQPSHAAQAAISPLFNQHPKVVLRCGRRFGKTTLLENCAATWVHDGEKVGWFAPSFKLILPTYKRILASLRPIVTSKSKVDMLIETARGNTQGLIEFWTLSDEDAGRSRSYDRIIIDEGSLVPKGLKDTWERAMAPTLLDRRGTAVMAGTPKGIDPDNFFYEACSTPSLGWHEVHAPTRDNPMLDPEGVANLVNEYPPLVYQQEFLADFVDWQGAAFFNRDHMLVGGQPVEWPSKCDMVFAVVDTAIKTGSKNDGTGVLYVAYTKYLNALVLLDYDLQQIEGALLEAWLPSVFARCTELAGICGARMGTPGAFIEDKATGQVLLQQTRHRNWPAQAIKGALTAMGKEERAINVSAPVYQGKVKISGPAFDRTVNYKGQVRNHLLSQVCGFRIGQKDGEDDILDCFTYAVAIALGNSEGYA